MSWTEALESINYLGVVAGVVAALVIGFLWYHPKFLGTYWGKLVGLKKKDMEDTSGMPVMMTMSVVFYFIVSLTLALLYNLTDGTNVAEGVLLGAIVGFAFAFGPIAVTYGYARRKFDLTLIDGGYVVLTTTVIGALVAYIS